MARDYDLDTKAATESNSGGKRIKDAGKYIGTFKFAFYEKNDKGTERVSFIFESEQGQEAGPLALYTHNGKGEELPSYKTFNAILACLKLRTIKSKRGSVTLYDFSSNSMVTKDKDTYPDLVGKRIGLLLKREEYENRSGDIKERLVIVAPFEAATGLMADEILNRQTEAKALTRVAEWVDKNPVKHLGRGAQRTAYAAAATAEAGEFVDDDIPF